MFIVINVKNKEGTNFEVLFNSNQIESITPLSKLNGEVDKFRALSAVKTISGMEFMSQDSFETLPKKLVGEPSILAAKGKESFRQ